MILDRSAEVEKLLLPPSLPSLFIPLWTFQLTPN